jgi:hypothetical protein
MLFPLSRRVYWLTFEESYEGNNYESWPLEHAHERLHFYSYLYEVKLLVNEIDQLVDDFHLLSGIPIHLNRKGESGDSLL